MPWMTIAFRDATAAATLAETFDRLWDQAGSPTGAAMYTDLRPLPRAENYYFSPGAVAIAGLVLSALGAVPCPEPDRTALTLLIGNAFE